MLSKLAGLATIGGTLTSVSLVQRTLTGITDLVALTALCALMAGMLLACGFYGLYIGMVAYGVDTATALIADAAIAFLIVLALAGMAYRRLIQLRQLPYYTLRREAPALAKVSSLVNAFMEGFSAGRPRS